MRRKQIKCCFWLKLSLKIPDGIAHVDFLDGLPCQTGWQNDLECG